MNESAIQRTAGFLPWLELGDFRIQTYFVVISIVLCACAWWIPSRAEKRGFSAREALDLFLIAMAGGLLGSRLLHIFWEEPAYYFENPWLVFDFVSGGFVWYGGAIGAGLAIFLWVRFGRGFARASDRDLLKWLDFFAPVTALGYAGGRIACVLTGCCFGKVCEWSHGHAFRFPTQALAVVWELAVGLILLKLETVTRGRASRFGAKRGSIFFLWLTLHGLGRSLMEIMRADPRGPAAGPVTISMTVSFALIAVGLYGLAKRRVSI